MDLNELNWSKKKKRRCPKIIFGDIFLTKKVIVYRIVVFNIADYQLFTITTYLKSSNPISFGGTHHLLPTTPVRRSQVAFHYG